MAQLTIKQMAEQNGVGIQPPSQTDRLLGENAAGEPTDYSAGQLASLVNTSNPALVPRYDIRQFGATSGGDDTAAFQAAIESGLSVYVPPGTYNVDTLNIPFEGCSLYGAGLNTTIIKGRTTNAPVMQWSHGGDVGDFRLGSIGGPRIELKGLRFDVLYNSTASLAGTRDNCSGSGFGYGPPALLFERSNFPSTTALTDPGFCNLPAHITLRDLVFSHTGTDNKNNFTPCVMFQGAAPSCYLHNLQAQDPNSMVCWGPPFVQRFTTSGNRIVTVGTNKFQNGQRVRIRSRATTGGSQPSGVSRSIEHTVTNRNATGFQLAGISTIPNGGKGFVILSGDAIGDFANEGIVATAHTNYTSRSTHEMTNVVSGLLSGFTSYGASHILLSDNIDSAVTTISENLSLLGLYSESPEGGSGSSDPLVVFTGEGVFVNGLQMRGAVSGSRPFLSFNGADHFISGIHGRSNFSTQANRQPDYRMNAQNMFIHGNLHSGGLFSQSDARGRIRQDGGSGNHFNNMTDWA